ncbi:MAG: hypothetical protein KBG48_30405 [Kofleriaceae bacterium]|jgi:hypothetical protein|nr:hypothetical protein [Kofleriaceae bacterium]MBP9171743.1 hypothetical protein [Kofleriaceae bacterium]MBP9856340.1 hypothetical protein [Kofleriaceae bacterium]
MLSFRAQLASLLLAVAVAACGGKAKPSAGNPPGPAATPIAPLTADGTSLADDAMLACADPAQPDATLSLMGQGSFEYQGAGAAVTGTYEFAGGMVRFTPKDAEAWASLTGWALELPVAADLTTVGGLTCRVPGV